MAPSSSLALSFFVGILFRSANSEPSPFLRGSSVFLFILFFFYCFLLFASFLLLCLSAVSRETGISANRAPRFLTMSRGLAGGVTPFFFSLSLLPSSVSVQQGTQKGGTKTGKQTPPEASCLLRQTTDPDVEA